MGGLAGRNKKEVRGREFRRKEEVPGFHPPTPQLFKIIIKVKGPSPTSSSNVTHTHTHTHYQTPLPYQRRRVGGRDRRR